MGEQNGYSGLRRAIMAIITLFGLNAGFTVHIHAAELDAEATVPDNGTVTFTVAADFHAEVNTIGTA